MNMQYSENSINSSKFIKDFVKCHAHNMIQIIYPEQRHGDIKFWGIKRKLMGLNYIKQLINSEDITN